MPPSKPQAILLVDGYNIVGAWSSLKDTRDRHGLESARRDLVEVLIGYSTFRGFETQIVFDAQYQGTPGHHEVVTPNLSIRYTDYRQTADTFIEKTCACFRKDVRKFEQRLIVATSDRAQQLTVIGYGAEWMSAQQLLGDVEVASRRIRRKQRAKKRTASRFLSSSLDPMAQQRLAQMRLGLEAEK
ncbi:MAG: NYN domain-containing protein [Elainellaceae cyanobacterium]